MEPSRVTACYNLGNGFTPENIQTLRFRGVKEVAVSEMDTDAWVLAAMFLFGSTESIATRTESQLEPTGRDEKAREIALKQFAN